MKKILFLIAILVLSLTIFCQSKISFGSDILKVPERNLLWSINGLTFSPTQEDVIIYPHINDIDTIYFQETRLLKTIYDTIYSIIPNNAELIITLGCCDDLFDIYTKEDIEESGFLFATNTTDVYDSIYSSRLQFCKIKFDIINKPISDTLICVFAGSFDIVQLITENIDYGWVEPCRFGYPDNIVDIWIIKNNKNFYFYELNDILSENCTQGIKVVGWNFGNWPIDQNSIIKKFGLRLFNNENVIIQFDYLTNELTLKFD